MSQVCFIISVSHKGKSVRSYIVTDIEKTNGICTDPDNRCDVRSGTCFSDTETELRRLL